MKKHEMCIRDRYRAFNNVNLQCKESIEAAVREHFDGMYLSHDAAKGVIETYGMERVALVLANTVQLQDWDCLLYTSTQLPWPKVQRRLAPLIQEDRFYTEEEQDRFDKMCIRDSL